MTLKLNQELVGFIVFWCQYIHYFVFPGGKGIAPSPSLKSVAGPFMYDYWLQQTVNPIWTSCKNQVLQML